MLFLGDELIIATLLLGEAKKKDAMQLCFLLKGRHVSRGLGWRSLAKIVFTKMFFLIYLDSFFYENDRHASKHINYSITYQAKSYKKQACKTGLMR